MCTSVEAGATPGVVASVLGAALTFASLADFTRMYTFPEEYWAGKKAEMARTAMRRVRLQNEKRIRDAMVPAAERFEPSPLSVL